MFCPKCGSILIPKSQEGETAMACSCGYIADGRLSLKEKVSRKREIDAVEEVEIHPVVDASCPKCGHGRAYFWEVQTRASDEPATKFMKCEKCRSIWRDYA